ncbi:MAG: MoaD/ThiS family protein [Actinomycetota bacterium]
MADAYVLVTMPRSFGAYADGTCEWKVKGATVVEALAAACSEFPELRGRIFDPSETGLRTYVKVFVDDEQADPLTPLKGGAHVRVLPALGGGSGSRRS